MSLPTYAKFYNTNNELIATQFVNVGWWLDEENFANAILNLPWVKDAFEVELYGIQIPKELLPTHNNSEWPEQRKKIQEYAIKGVKYFNLENQELKEALKLLYKAECNKE